MFLFIVNSAVAGGLVEHVVAQVPACSGLTLTEVTVNIDELKTKTPANTITTTDVNHTYNLLAGEGPTFPNGTWVQATVVMLDDVHIEGSLTGGGTFEIDLAIDRIPFFVTGQMVIASNYSGVGVLRYADTSFIQPNEVWVAAGQHRVVTPNDAGYAAILDRFVELGAWYQQ